MSIINLMHIINIIKPSNTEGIALTSNPSSVRWQCIAVDYTAMPEPASTLTPQTKPLSVNDNMEQYHQHSAVLLYIGFSHTFQTFHTLTSVATWLVSRLFIRAAVFNVFTTQIFTNLKKTSKTITCTTRPYQNDVLFSLRSYKMRELEHV